MTLTKCFVRGHLFPPQSPLAHCELYGLKLNLCLKNRLGLLLRHIKRASSLPWPSHTTQLCSLIHPWAYDELMTVGQVVRRDLPNIPCGPMLESMLTPSSSPLCYTQHIIITQSYFNNMISKTPWQPQEFYWETKMHAGLPWQRTA